jgi:hypothetical protein
MGTLLKMVAVFVVLSGVVSCASVDRSTASQKEEIHKVDRGTIHGRY